jgi:hypothetical protein
MNDRKAITPTKKSPMMNPPTKILARSPAKRNAVPNARTSSKIIKQVNAIFRSISFNQFERDRAIAKAIRLDRMLLFSVNGEQSMLADLDPSLAFQADDLGSLSILDIVGNFGRHQIFGLRVNAHA